MNVAVDFLNVAVDFLSVVSSADFLIVLWEDYFSSVSQDFWFDFSCDFQIYASRDFLNVFLTYFWIVADYQDLGTKIFQTDRSIV